ncbi:YqaA family protein [Inmirania thermothiophila]|uniref:Membrane protein YqaA with SNARE-associated domain n=1 Tax=Inmirania thermothiophila TaxID=1750597 RepID=A0A3N1Y076_9GAMM|nr:YqaA family protein [Inmirania thermothiophila]ROR32245.1 membrane protein YqaA with SNARE-associated domain [Inmirania thermothiophila]
MRPFRRLYARVMAWSRHPRAPWLLGLLSFAESSFFPVPPDVMLAPMALARPQRAWRLAALTTAASVAGGIAGYAIGALAFDLVAPWLERAGYWEAYLQARTWFARHGLWVILLAGFSPIPYKVFTIAAGVAGMPLVPFVAGSVAGRGGRFFLVAGLMRLGGARMEAALHRWVDGLGWGMVAAAAVLWLVLRGG